MVKELKAEGLTEEMIIPIIQKVTGVDAVTAGFIYAIETGEIGGDVVEIGKDGKETYPKGSPITDFKTK